MSVLSALHNEIVDEHIEASGVVDQSRLGGIVHLALGSGDEDIGSGARLEHLDQLARGLVLRIGEGHFGVLFRIQRLHLVEGLRKRIGRENLQLDALLLRRRLLRRFLSRFFGGLRASAEHRHGERSACQRANRDARRLLP